MSFCPCPCPSFNHSQSLPSDMNNDKWNMDRTRRDTTWHNITHSSSVTITIRPAHKNFHPLSSAQNSIQLLIQFYFLLKLNFVLALGIALHWILLLEKVPRFIFSFRKLIKVPPFIHTDPGEWSEIFYHVSKPSTSMVIFVRQANWKPGQNRAKRKYKVQSSRGKLISVQPYVKKKCVAVATR